VPIETKKVNLASLSYEIPPDDDDFEASTGLVVSYAELHGGEVIVHCYTDLLWNEIRTVHVVVEDIYRHERLRPDSSPSSGRMTTVSVTAPGTWLEETETPVVVRLEIETSKGQPRRGRTWLSRPDMIAMDAKERALFRAASTLTRQVFTSNAQWQIFAEGLADIVNHLHANWQRATSKTAANSAVVRTASSPETTLPEKDLPLVGEDLCTTELAVGFGIVGGKRGGVGSLIERMLKGVQRLFAPLEPDDRARMPAPTKNRIDTGGVAGDLGDEDDEFASEAAPVSSLDEAVIHRVVVDLGTTCASLMQEEVAADRVEVVVTVLEHVTGTVFLPMYIQAVATQSHGARELSRAMRDLFAQAFSLHGLTEGRPQGWLARAWADEATREQLGEQVNAERIARIIALLCAAAAASRQTGSAEWQGLDGILVGLQLVTGRTQPVDSRADDPLVRQQMTRLIANSQSVFQDVELQDALPQTDPLALPVVSTAARWLPIISLSRADATHSPSPEAPARWDGPADQELLAAYRRLRSRCRPAVVNVVTGPDQLSCGYCYTALSTGLAAKVRAAGPGYQTCESCGRMLVPFDFDNPATRQILGSLLPGFAEGL